MCNRASLKILAFASSDSPKSSIKIPYPERNTVEKKPMVTVLSVNSWKTLPLDVKFAESSTQLISKQSHVALFWKVSVGFLAFNLPLKIYV